MRTVRRDEEPRCTAPPATAGSAGPRYRAANWIHVGQTQGRGKLDVHKQFALPVKDILLKPLHPHWRSILNR